MFEKALQVPAIAVASHACVVLSTGCFLQVLLQDQGMCYARITSEEQVPLTSRVLDGFDSDVA